MKSFQIDLNFLPKIVFLGKETLIPPRTHYSRSIMEYIVYVMVKGELNLKVNGKNEKLIGGDVFVFAPGDVQEAVDSSFCEYYYIHFKSDGITDFELSENQYVEMLKCKQEKVFKTDAFSYECYSNMNVLLKSYTNISDENIFKGITEILKNNILTSRCKLPKNRYDISVALARLFFMLESSELKRSGGEKKLGKRYDTVRSIAEYIEKHYKENIGSADIEREFYLSFDYANRIFKRTMGCSIVHYRNAVRIQNAKAKLRITNISVKDIANEFGFENVFYFSRVFKKSEGLSPSEYKKKFIKNNGKGE